MVENDNENEVHFTEVQGPFNAELLQKTKCWALQQPLLIRNAFSVHEHEDNAHWPTKQEILELACDEDSESRIISHVPGDDSSYQLELGPFEYEQVTALLHNSNKDTTRYTLIVNDLDRHLPSLADWVGSTFDFVPSWRRDDAQLSWSNLGGGIGRHVDNYDVILLQTHGLKEWRIARLKPNHDQELQRLIPDLDVRVLSSPTNHNDELVIIVEPGDALYLPPRVSHKGTAFTHDSATLSIGFRAPSATDLISRIAETLSFNPNLANQRYTESTAVLNYVHDNQIHPQVKEDMRLLILEAVNKLLHNETHWDQWLGSFLTLPKRDRFDYPRKTKQQKSHAILDSFLNGRCTLCQAQAIVFAYTKEPNRLFVDGNSWDVSEQVPVHIIANRRKLTLDDIRLFISQETIKLLTELVQHGYLYQEKSP